MRRRSRFPNVSLVLIALLIIVLGIRTMVAPRAGVSIYGNIPAGARLIPVVLTGTGLALWFWPRARKIRKFIRPVLLIVLATQVVEYVALPVVAAYLEVRDLPRIPGQERFLASMVYIVVRYWPDFLRGLAVTLRLSLIGTLAGLLLAIVFVFFRTLPVNERDGEITAFSKRTGATLVKTYVNVFRGTPMMVQAVIIYYLFPIALAALFRVSQAAIDRVFTLMTAGLVVVTLNTAAYLTEVLRGGIESVDKGQLEAARSLGMSYWQAMRHVIFPQGIKTPCRRYATNSDQHQGYLGPQRHWRRRIVFVAQDAKYQYYRTYEPFLIAAVIYLVVTFSTSRLIMALEEDESYGKGAAQQ